MSSMYFRNALCLTQDSGAWVVKRHSIEIRDGVISALEDDKAPGSIPDNMEMIDASGMLVVPGFVNAHSHSPDNLVRGTGDNLPLELWSLSSSAGRENRSLREVYLSVLLGAIEMMRNGTTSVLDHVRISPDINADALDAVASAWLDSGMRATIAPIVSDRAVVDTMPFEARDFDGVDQSAFGTRLPLPAAEQIAIVEDFYERWHGRGNGRIRVAIGPSAPQRCSDELLVQAADFSLRKNALLHMHVLETDVQQHMGDKLYRNGTISHLADLGLLSSRTHLVHCIWVNESEIETIARHDACVVHNPVSNARLGSGYCKLPAMLDRGVRVALGTDSTCCNDGSSMLETMKWTAILHNLASTDPSHWIGPDRALAMGTVGGADAIGLGDNIGRIAKGLSADLTLYRLASPSFVPLREPVRQLVLSETGMSHGLTLCCGRALARDGRATVIDERAVWQEAEELAARRKRDNASVYESAKKLETPIKRMRARLIGGCACH